MSEKMKKDVHNVQKEVKTEVLQETTQTKALSPTPVRAVDKYKGKYILKPCKQTWISQIDPQHDGAYLFSETKIYVAPELDKNTNLVKTGLTEDEARELELEMGLQKMSLSPYNKAFWSDFKLYPKVPQSGVVLDLDNSALDKLRYLYCRVSSKVANSHADALENPMAELVMTSTEKEAKAESSRVKVKTEAYKHFANMTISEQIDFLKVFEEGKFKVGKSSSPDFINSVLGKIVDSSPEKFLDTLNNPYYKTISFLQDCIQAGLIRKSGTVYSLAGGDKIGDSFLNTIENLHSSEYNEVKVSLKHKLETLK